MAKLNLKNLLPVVAAGMLLVTCASVSAACTYVSGSPEVSALSAIQIEVPECSAEASAEYKELSALLLDYGLREQVTVKAVEKVVGEIGEISSTAKSGEKFNIAGDITNFQTTYNGLVIKGFLGDGTDCEGIVYVNVYNTKEICVGSFAMKVFFINLPTDLASDVNA